jgi:citrate synthase
VGALSGALHGGANTRVMEMLMEIGGVDKADAYVRQKLESGDVIFGMGHAVYKTYDPRMYVLQPMSERLGKRTGNTLWYDMSMRIMESTQKIFRELKGKEIYPNVDFFSASVYEYMGIEPHLFTPLFALSRVAGWCAHVIEEKFAEAQPKPALYRPLAEYIGNYCGPEGCVFIPMDQRGKE